MKRRGHIEVLPSGRARARRGKKHIGTYESKLEAEIALGGGTMASRWEEFALSRRSLVRDWKGEESRWSLYFENDPIAQVPFTELHRRHAKAWLGRMVSNQNRYSPSLKLFPKTSHSK
jgi:hypothetical protein